MLEKELAQAIELAEKANNKVEQLRRKLVSESEKEHARSKRALMAARKKYTLATARLNKARAALKSKATLANEKKVDELVTQVQDLSESVARISVAAYEAAEKLLIVKADAIIASRRARVAERTAFVVEKAAAKSSDRRAGKKKPATPKEAATGSRSGTDKKKRSVGKKSAANKKAAGNGAPVARKKVAAKKKAPARRNAATKSKAG